MRFLIAGSSGFLGTRLRERLVDAGHQVTRLVRRTAGPGEVQWDPYAGPLGVDVVDDHDVVVNLAGTPTFGNPHSKKWARNLRDSRVTTTRVLAEAIARSDTRPAFLAGNAVGYYGDHGDQPVTEATPARSDSLMSAVCRDWQEATHAARSAGARVTVLRTAPLMDRRSMPLKALRLLYRAGLGGKLGDGSQSMPMISARDWTAAALHCVDHEVEGPVNLVCAQTPTNEQFTHTLADLVHRPAFVTVPAPLLRVAAGPLSGEVLGSMNIQPAKLLATGFTFADPDVRAVLTQGLAPTQ